MLFLRLVSKRFGGECSFALSCVHALSFSLRSVALSEAILPCRQPIEALT